MIQSAALRWLSGAALIGALLLPRAAEAKRDAKPDTVEARYERGQKYMKRGYYVKALDEFNRIRNYNRDHPLAVMSELAIADVYYKKAEWDQARVAYEDFMRLHPRHEEMDYVVYRLGQTAYNKSPRIAARDQTWTKQALNAWSGFTQRYPESEHLEEVQELLDNCRNRLAHKEYIIGDFYLKRESWPAAIARLEGMLRQYPGAKDEAKGLSRLAYALHQSGETDRAVQAVQRLQTDHPGSNAERWLQRKAPELTGLL